MWWTAARVRRGARRVGFAVLVREDSDQSSVAGIEVEVALGRVVEVRLLEDERHAEHALPEVDRRLAVGADDRDVVDTLALELAHHRAHQFGLVIAPLQAAPRHELDLRLDDKYVAQPLTDRVGEVEARRRARDSSTETGSGGSCFTPAARGRTRMCPLTSGANPLTTSRTADGKTFTPRTISMSSVRPMQRTAGAVRPHAQGLVQTSTWSRVRKRSSGAARWRRCVSTSSPVAPSSSSTCLAGLRVDQLGMDEAACAEVHPVLLLALAPERVPMSPIPIASVTARPSPPRAPRGTRARRRRARRRRAPL